MFWLYQVLVVCLTWFSQGFSCYGNGIWCSYTNAFLTPKFWKGLLLKNYLFLVKCYFYFICCFFHFFFMHIKRKKVWLLLLEFPILSHHLCTSMEIHCWGIVFATWSVRSKLILKHYWLLFVSYWSLVCLSKVTLTQSKVKTAVLLVFLKWHLKNKYKYWPIYFHLCIWGNKGMREGFA